MLVAILDWSEIATRFEPVEGSFHVLRSFVACHLSNSLPHEVLKQNHSPFRLRFFSCSARTFSFALSELPPEQVHLFPHGGYLLFL